MRPSHVLACLLVALAARAAADTPYEAEVKDWRDAYEARLRSEDGWLAVAGLTWIEEGTSRFGSAPGNEVVLPEGAAPPLAGTLERRGKSVVVSAAPGVSLRSGDEAVTAREVQLDKEWLTLGRLRFMLIERGERVGVRLRDPENPRRKSFTGTVWYPVKPALRVKARFVPHKRPRTVAIPDVLGEVHATESPGRVEFRVGGKRVVLHPVPGGDGRLWFIFSDGTSAKEETYPGGRFLYADAPEGGTVFLDFNKAYSPPCAYTDFATCPLPPKENRLTVPIEAGERYVRHD